MICAICGNGLQRTVLDESECLQIKKALEDHGNNQKHAADSLRMSLATFRRKVLKHGLREAGKALPLHHRGGHPCPVVGNGEVEPS